MADIIFTQNFTNQYAGRVWPLPSGLIYAGAPPLSSGPAVAQG